MAGHIAVGVSTAYYADEHLFDGIASSIPELARLRNSMATTSVSIVMQNYCAGLKQGFSINFYVNRTYIIYQYHTKDTIVY